MISLTDLILGTLIGVVMMLVAHRWYYGRWW